MTVRRFTFEPTLEGRSDFRVAYEAFRSRDPEKCIREERAGLAVIQRVLESVSDPKGELPEDAEFDIRVRKLKPEGGTIELKQRHHESLRIFVTETRFAAGLSIYVENFLDRWTMAERVEMEDDAPGPKVIEVSGRKGRSGR